MKDTSSIPEERKESGSEGFMHLGSAGNSIRLRAIVNLVKLEICIGEKVAKVIRSADGSVRGNDEVPKSP